MSSTCGRGNGKVTAVCVAACECAGRSDQNHTTAEQACTPHLILVVIAVCQKRDQFVSCALLAKRQCNSAQALD